MGSWWGGGGGGVCSSIDRKHRGASYDERNSLITTDVTAAMLVERTLAKKSWKFEQVIIQSLSYVFYCFGTNMAVLSRECSQRVFHNWKTLKIIFYLLPSGAGWSYWKVPWLSSFARYADRSHQTSDRPSKPRVQPCKRQGPSPSPYAHIDQAALLVSGLGERAKRKVVMATILTHESAK